MTWPIAVELKSFKDRVNATIENANEIKKSFQPFVQNQMGLILSRLGLDELLYQASTGHSIQCLLFLFFCFFYFFLIGF